jgi:hypothetical protein
MDIFSTELRLAISPDSVYGELLGRDLHVTWLQMLLRPAIVVLAIAIVIPMMTVHHVTLGLAATSALFWGPAVIVEIAAAACIIASASTRQVSMARAIDLWFAGHLPFSTWLLMLPIATYHSSIHPLEIIGFTATVPTIWTAFLVEAFCRTVLGTTPAGARWRAGIHLGAFVLVASVLFVISAGGSAAVFSYVLRRITN